jgi:glycosyltransferase involved in cell wall biosynthesis
MRIAYVCYWNVYRLDGVARKITTQVEHWRRAGHEAEVFALTPARGGEQRWPAHPFPFRGPAGRVLAATRLLGALRRFRPDVVYLRYELLPPPLHLLTRLHSTVVELNSDEHAEYRLRARRQRLADRYGRWNWRTLFRSAAGVVSVTEELVRLVEPYGRPTVVIANGIELAEIEPLPPSTSTRPTLVFSGTPGQAWHGVDKLVALAEAAPELDVILLGLEPRPSLPPNLEAHRYLAREEYEPLFRRADAALGTAALHRKGMNEACALKVREYLAYGLPVVLPYEDTDLVGLDDWFLLRVPNEERNLVDHAGEIVAFVRGVHGRRVPREAVGERIGAEAKERRRLAFLSGLARA